MHRSEFQDLHVIEHEGTAFNANVFFWDLTQSPLWHSPSLGNIPSELQDATLISMALTEVSERTIEYQLAFEPTGQVADPCHECGKDLSDASMPSIRFEEGYGSFHPHCHDKWVEERYGLLAY